jgi:DNA-binding transcriptional LysR family regulator
MLLRHLSYFVALAREKHFARASEACNIAQPTLSAAIRKIEDDLQVPLVVRGHRYVGLTPEGEKVLEWGRQILADYASLRDDLSGMRRGLGGTLRLGVVPAAMPAVSFLTARLSTMHPAVSVEIRTMPSRAIQNGLDAFEIDGGLTYLDNEPLEHVRRVPLYKERYVFVTRRGNSFTGRRTVTWKEAVGERLCLLVHDMQNRRIIDAVAASEGLQIEAAVTTNSFLGICAHLAQGGWSSIVPHTFWHALGRPAEFVMIDLVEPVASQAIGLVVSDREPLSSMAAALLAVASKIDLDADFALADSAA